MQPIISSSSDIVAQANANRNIASVPANANNVQKTENKSTEAINANNKAEEKLIEKNQIEQKQNDKRLQENIAEEKLVARQVEKEVSKETASLEAQKSYAPPAPNDGIETQTALEVAVEKQDILESVKSVKPDGTETYYFPVPVEVLAQLPPPGNIGISAKMLDDIIKAQSEKPKETDAKAIEVNLKANEAKNIYLNTSQKISSFSEPNDDEASKNSDDPPRKSDNAQLEYGFG